MSKVWTVLGVILVVAMLWKMNRDVIRYEVQLGEALNKLSMSATTKEECE